MTENDKNLISVIIPLYNAEKYLKNCITSVVGQTYRNLEIILVDDGSNDNSLSICEKFALQDNRIKVFHQNNGGVASARNTDSPSNGIRLRCSDYAPTAGMRHDGNSVDLNNFADFSNNGYADGGILDDN